MNSIVLLLIFEDTKALTIEKYHEELNNYFKERSYESKKSDNIIIFYRNNEKIIIEYRQLEHTSKYIYNIFYNINLNKRNLLQQIYFSNFIVNSIVLYDTGSNKILNENYSDFSEFENLIKYYIGSMIIHAQGIDGFKIIKNFKVKEDIYKKHNKIITTLQRLELRNLVKYINNNPIGGNEINILREFSLMDEFGKPIYTEEKKENIRENISTNIFIDLKKVLDSCEELENIYEWRNCIAHNSCVEDSIFINLSQKVIKLNKEITEIAVNLDEKNSGFNGLKILPVLSVVLNSEKSINNILLRIIELYNEIYEDSLFDEFIDSKNIIRNSNGMMFKSKKISIVIYNIKPSIINNYINELNVYKILIYTDELNLNSDLSNKMFTLLDKISNEYIVLYDKASNKLCADLYRNINTVENMVRLYIKLSEHILNNLKIKNINKVKTKKADMKMMIDLNALQIKLENEKVNFVNNDLIGIDFISLLDKLSNPLIEKSLKKIIEEDKYEDIKKFNESIADLPAIDQNIESIKNKWKKLYNIRTMVAHSFILNYNEFVEYNNLFLEAKKEIEIAIYKLLKERISGYSLEYDIEVNGLTLTLKDLNEKYILEMRNATENSAFYIPVNEIWRVIITIYKLNINYDAIILTSKLIEEFSDKDKISTNINGIKNDLSQIIRNYECNITDKSNNFRILEEEISKLLKYISEKRSTAEIESEINSELIDENE